MGGNGAAGGFSLGAAVVVVEALHKTGAARAGNGGNGQVVVAEYF